MSADLVAFLSARLDEDEAHLRPFVNGEGQCRPWRADEVGGRVRVDAVLIGDDGVIADARTHLDAVHIARNDPARVLRQVEAVRAIVDNCERARIAVDSVPMADRVSSGDDTVSAYWRGQHWALKALAAIYRDHEDYCEEWAL